MAAVSRVNDVVSSDAEVKQHQVAGRHKLGWFLDTVGKYALDFSVIFSGKRKIGLLQLHKTVQEELKGGPSLKVCNSNVQKKQELDTKSRSEKIQEEMNTVKLKNETSTEKVEPVSSNKFPHEQAEEDHDLMPNRRRIFIRSRL